MGYIVLARKYRPQHFKDVVGQETAAQTLVNAIASNRVAHAYLFAGPRGVGKTSMARILARALNCRTGPTANPCGECDLCTSIARGDNVDVIEIDGASNRGIDEVRELRENAKYIPTSGRYKIYIIDEVHMLTEHAFNALLKTLEEPPPHVIFIFATTGPQKLPETIRSRCQRLDFKRIPTARIVETLRRVSTAEGIDIDDAALRAIARNARGGLRDSESLLDQLVSFTGRDIKVEDVYEALGALPREDLFKIVDLINEGKAAEALDLLNTAIMKGIDNEAFLDELLEHYRILMLLKVCGPDSPLIDENTDDLTALQHQVAAISTDTLLYTVQVLSDAKMRVRNTVEGRIPVEMALIRLAHIEKMVPLDQLAQRLEALEQSLSGGGGAPAARPFQRQAADGFAVNEESSSLEQNRELRQAAAAASVKQDGSDWSRILLEVAKTSPSSKRMLIGMPKQDDQLVVIRHLKGIGFNQATIERAVKTVLKTDARIVFEEVKGDAPLPVDDPADAGQPETAEDETPQIASNDPFADYYNDPAVQTIMKLFGGRIVGVKGAKECPKD